VYTEPTQQRQKRKRKRIICAVVATCAVVVVLCIALNLVFTNAKEQGAASIRNTILDSAMQCAAIEGSFPTNLAYLEDHYDLRVNHDDYVVIYEVLASNTLPSVVVMPR
jgi:flagellar basal body-associated protein FliL